MYENVWLYYCTVYRNNYLGWLKTEFRKILNLFCEIFEETLLNLE